MTGKVTIALLNCTKNRVAIAEAVSHCGDSGWLVALNEPARDIEDILRDQNIFHFKDTASGNLLIVINR